MCPSSVPFFFFFNDTATTEIYTLSLHDALPICLMPSGVEALGAMSLGAALDALPQTRIETLDIFRGARRVLRRSEEHTSELQSRLHLVCRLLLEKKKKIGQAEASSEPRRSVFIL